MFDAIERAPVIPERVALTIRERIESGRLPPGSRLPSESALAQDFGVSRPSVREAISRLKQEGLLQSRPGQGAFVAPEPDLTVLRISAECFEKRLELRQILELRTSVEADAAAYAARNRTDAQVRAMAREVKRLVAVSSRPVDAGAIDAWFDAERNFYRVIAEASGNSYFVQFLQGIDARLRTKLHRAALNNVRVAELRPEVTAEHAAILKAIRDGDPERASFASRAHFTNAAGRIAERGDLRD